MSATRRVPSSVYSSTQTESSSSNATPTSSSYPPGSSLEEDAGDYREGGLHPVRVGELLGGRWSAERHLGCGHFSAVWACRGSAHAAAGTGRVAVKLLKSVEKYKGVAEREVDMLRRVANAAVDPGWQGSTVDNQNAPMSATVVRLLDHFEHTGPHGVHPCLVMELCGPSLLTVLRSHSHGRLRPRAAWALAVDALRGLDLLHRGCNLIHADVKPENIMLRRGVSMNSMMDTNNGAPSKRRKLDVPPCIKGANDTSGKDPPASLRRRAVRSALEAALAESGVVFCLADLGNSRYSKNLRGRRSVQTVEYKPPEALLAAGYGTPSDVWALGCTLFECLAGERPFTPNRVRRWRRHKLVESGRHVRPEDVPVEEEHLAQIVENLGPLPEGLLSRGERTEELLRRRSSGEWHLRKAGLPLGDGDAEGLTRELRRRAGVQAVDFEDMLLAMLRLEPSRRPEARELIELLPQVARRGA